MRTSSRPNLYESPDMLAVTGEAVRPGGLELTRRALDICRLEPGAFVLDAGCGRGATAALLNRSGLAAVGMDCSKLLLEQGRTAHADVAFVRGRAEALPFGDGLFSALFCECVLSLIERPAAALEAFSRVLRPGGWLLLSDLYARSGGCQGGRTASLPMNCCLNGAMRRDVIEKLLANAGFAVRLWEDHTPMLKQFAAKLVFALGSLDALRKLLGNGAAHGGDLLCDAAASPHCGSVAGTGYYLLAARKE